MSTKHTPGPWHRNIRANGHYPVVFAGRNQHVATASQQTDPAETEANIDLLAAAPNMLKVLKLCQQADFCKHILNTGETLAEAIDAVIYEATGNIV